MGETRDIIVIGGSMGAIEALKDLIAELPPEIPASLFAVIHTSSASPGNLAQVLARKSPLPVQSARHGESYRRGTLYIAPPDRHLLIRDGRMLLTRGPRENRTRPAIDPLFRSAAVCCAGRVTGVILSGYMDDGAAGLNAIKRCGGAAMVQDPRTTLYPDMPSNALQSVEVDHCIPIHEMSSLLADISRLEAPPAPAIPEALRIEAEVTEKMMGDFGQEKRPGHSTDLSCPDCGGPLWQMEGDKMARFRCTVGHAFTEKNLLAGQSDAAEKALWVALRTLEERVRFLQRLAQNARSRNQAYVRWEEQAAETDGHVDAIRNLLMGRGVEPVRRSPVGEERPSH